MFYKLFLSMAMLVQIDTRHIHRYLVHLMIAHVLNDNLLLLIWDLHSIHELSTGYPIEPYYNTSYVFDRLY